MHKHSVGIALNLWGLATFAFILGFAHEEEFALLALAASGINAWALMISYGLAVLLGLIASPSDRLKFTGFCSPDFSALSHTSPK